MINIIAQINKINVNMILQITDAVYTVSVKFKTNFIIAKIIILIFKC